jgi:pSer/pThr/pTyr-binding forkhead associated (FHA) protein
MRRGVLEVPRGPLAGLRLPLMDGTFVFGRGSQAGIELPDKSVSRRHAEIRVEGDQLSIRDLGSTNGTRLNGQLITAWRTLRDGDEIQLGDLPLVVQLLE